eukprot:1547390-Prymnesium_polylepis.1
MGKLRAVLGGWDSGRGGCEGAAWCGGGGVLAACTSSHARRAGGWLALSSSPYDSESRVPQFWLCWTLVLGNAMSGITLISSAKTIMSDIYCGPALPSHPQPPAQPSP